MCEYLGGVRAADGATQPEITVATPVDRDRTVDSLVVAFARDPAVRYMFPDQQTYPAYAGAFFSYLFDKRVRGRTIWTIAGGASAAIWEAPGAGGQPPVEGLAARLPADALARVDAYDAALAAALPPTPFWYLGVLGTHPAYAGRGWGRAVMRVGLRRAAAEGLPAVLETSNPANVDLYRRAGWQVVRQLSEPLTIWIMQRSPGESHPA